MKEKLIAFFHLTRIKENLPVLVSATLLGAVATQAPFAWSLILVLGANILFSWAFFILRDLQFAPLDIVDKEKQALNPIAEGIFKVKTATFLWVFSTIIAITLYAQAGTKLLFFGLGLSIVILILSWRKLGLQRFFYLKTSPYHWLVNGLFCLLGSLSLDPVISQNSILAVTLIVFYLLYIAVLDQTRKAEPGYPMRRLNIASAINLAIASLAGVALFIFVKLLPFWILALFILLVAIMIVPQLIERNREKQKPLFEHESLRKAFFNASAISLAVHYLAPVIFQIFTK